MTTTQLERLYIFSAMTRLGITPDDQQKLRRISLTIRRWYELECGSESGAIERDEATGKPQWRSACGKYHHAVADREKGALQRLTAIMSHYPHLVAYVQTDPRGAALYLIRREQLSAEELAELDCYYSRGIAIY